MISIVRAPFSLHVQNLIIVRSEKTVFIPRLLLLLDSLGILYQYTLDGTYIFHYITMQAPHPSYSSLLFLHSPCNHLT